MLDIISAEGNRKTLDSVGNIRKNTRMGVQKALYKIGKDLQSTFNQQVLSKDKTGIIYIRRDRLGRRRRHQSSAAGESPANRTGNYRKNIGFKISGWRNLKFGNSAEYAGHLELGTSRMAKRPGLGNAVNANERNIIRHLSGEVSNEI